MCCGVMGSEPGLVGLGSVCCDGVRARTGRPGVSVLWRDGVTDRTGRPGVSVLRWGQGQDWSAWGQCAVAKRDIMLDLVLSQCDSTYNCLSRSMPEIHCMLLV